MVLLLLTAAAAAQDVGHQVTWEISEGTALGPK